MKERITAVLHNRLFSILIVSVFGLVGMGVVLYSTVWGAALTDDSYHYISAARNLLAGQGFSLTPHFLPILSLILSLLGLFKIDPLVSIRYLNAVLFTLNIILFAWIVYRLTKDYFFSIIGALFVMLSSTMIMVHSWAMSEALFLFFTLAGILAYTATENNRTWVRPFLVGLFFGLAAGTRYIGVSLLLAGGVIWLLGHRDSVSNRLRSVGIFSLTGVLPLLMWALYNQVASGQFTSRDVAWHPMPEDSWINILNAILLWFIPGRFVHGRELLWLAVISLILIFYIRTAWFKQRSQSPEPGKQINLPGPITLIILTILAYLIVLIVSRSFFDVLIPMDERLLSPILVMGLLLLMWTFSRLWNIGTWLAFGIIAMVSLVFLITNFTRSVQMVQSYHADGRGYASARDHISETYAYLRNRPEIPVYSNAYTAIYFWTGKATDPIPAPTGIQAMKDDMRQNGAFLVIFDSIPVELYGTTREELTAGLVEQIRLSESTIYRSP